MESSHYHPLSAIAEEVLVAEEPVAAQMPTEAVHSTSEWNQTLSQRSTVSRRSGLTLLAASDLVEWDALVEASPQCSIFAKSWWLRAACDEPRVLGYFEDGRLIAGIPLHYEWRLGQRFCCMPRLTQTMGVAIAPQPGKSVTVESRETEILNAFAERLAGERIFIQAFHPECRNWLPFYWAGFTQTTHYTYVLDDLSSVDRIWDGLDKDRRTNIRKARREGIQISECGPEEVYTSSAASLERQGLRCKYTLDYLSRLVYAARENNAGTCFAARDSRGRLHAAVFFVWDSRHGYQLAGGHDTALGSSGATVLLVWNLIEFAASRTAVFDFEGSMRQQIESSFRSFGTKRIPYHRIVKMPRWMRIGLCAAGKVSL
jgi:Acetyltransferase (GNAT) domain